MNAKITAATITQTGNEVLGLAEKQLHYLVIEGPTGAKYKMNVGAKTIEEINKILNEKPKK